MGCNGLDEFRAQLLTFVNNAINFKGFWQRYIAINLTNILDIHKMFSACSIFQIPAITNNNMVEVVTCEAGATQVLHKQQS